MTDDDKNRVTVMILPLNDENLSKGNQCGEHVVPVCFGIVLTSIVA